MIGSLLLVIPALVQLTGTARVLSALQALKSQLITHNAAMMTVLFAILAANELAQVIHRLAA
jgi:drug/metabolite transporter superfamily protein YnfA